MVTSKLTWVVRISGDSTRCPPSAANLIWAALIANADASGIGILSDQRESKGLLLIANLELEFRITPIRISELKIPNRKFSAILYPASPTFFSLELQGFSFQSPWPPKPGRWRRRLIENARLRSHVSPLRISQLQISLVAWRLIENGWRSLSPCWALPAGLTGHSPLATLLRPSPYPLPSTRNTLTCRALTA